MKLRKRNVRMFDIVWVAMFFVFCLYIFFREVGIEEKQSTSKVMDYDLGNCSFIHNPDKIMVCFDFNQDGKSLGAYATSSKTIFLRTTAQGTVRHEALHHLLYRDTNLNEEQQHKFISDLEEIEMEIFKLRMQ